MKPLCSLILTLFLAPCLIAQTETDSLVKDHEKRLDEHSKLLQGLLDSIHGIRLEFDHSGGNILLNGERNVTPDETQKEEPKLTIGGYVSVYYAWYSDTSDQNNFQKFPGSAPRSGAFALNLTQLTARYSSRTVRANLALHFGDIPTNIWSPDYNSIQEANAGVRLVKGLWLDAGFFRSHIGLESMQPRENMATGAAVLSYFEPYYLAGAKITYQFTQHFSLQLNAFNSINGFTENNKKKALGLSFTYQTGNRLSITFNSIWNDDSPDSAALRQGRLYNNLFLSSRFGRFTLGLEGNYGLQQNTSISGVNHNASMWSALAEAKMRIYKQFFCYGRIEYFNDPDQMLTGPLYNSNKEPVGLNLSGITFGLELKPRPNSYLRFEGRALATVDSKQKIFEVNSSPSSTRNELILSFGVWF